MRKVTKVREIDFTKKIQAVVERYNKRKEDAVLKSEVYEDMAEQLTNLIWEVQIEFSAGGKLGLGINFEKKAFYDILKSLCFKYEFHYLEDQLILLSKEVKKLVDAPAKFPDWDKREDIQSAFKVELILLLNKPGGYQPVERDEVYQDIFE